MYAAYEKLIKVYFPEAVHQFCWFHLNFFHLGATVRQAQSGFRQAHLKLESFESKHPRRRNKSLMRRHAALSDTREQAYRFWVGAKRYQNLLKNCLQAHSLQQATEKLDRLIRLGQDHRNPYIHEMATFIESHRSGLVTFLHCLEHKSLLHPHKHPSPETTWIRV